MPIAIIVLLIINCFVFWKEIELGPTGGEALLKKFGLIPLRDFSTTTHFWLPYLSSMFLHGGFFHLFANMWTLWLFGGSVESELGSIRFIVYYICCGLVAAVAHVYLNPTSTMPVVGASGAISGIMGAYLLLFPRSRIKMFTLLIFYPIFFEIPAFIFLIFWFLGQLMAAAAQGPNVETGGVAFAAHIGGFIAGMALLPVFIWHQHSKAKK